MRYILWSGGWDSTYLLCKMARESSESIQPIYIVRPECSNTPYERMARRTMLPLIRAKDETLAEILNPIEIKEEDLPEDAVIDAAYEKYAGKVMLLYGFMGKAAKLYPGLAIAAEAPAPGTREISRTKQYILDGGLSVDGKGTLTRGKNADKDAWALFGGLTFPLLDVNKAQMMEDVIAWGWLDDIFKFTFGCYRPSVDYCGVCGVCELELAYGDIFDWRFTEEAKKHHAIKKWLAENKGDEYAEAFRAYVMNNHSVSSTMTANAAEVKLYFDFLEKYYPNIEGIYAPVL